VKEEHTEITLQDIITGSSSRFQETVPVRAV